MKKYNIAIVGATGLVGQTILKIIEEYDIPFKQLKLYASERTKGQIITFKGIEYQIQTIKEGCFLNTDFALFSAGSVISKAYAKQAVLEGATVIDNSSAFRMDKDVPLIVPEVNMNDAYGKKLIANPNCSTIECVVPLKALDIHFGINSVEYNTYQAVSGAGIKGIKDLTSSGQLKNHFPYDIKQTCIPQIDDFLEDGFTKEEHKMIDETRKILHLGDLLVCATCVRVPVLNSHGVSIKVVLKRKFNLDEIRHLFNETKGLVVLDEPERNIYPTSIHANGNDSIFIGRMRKDKIDKNALLLYVVSDNIRKGAASNTVQIMKGLMDYENSI